LLRTGLNEECQRRLDDLEVAYGRDFEDLPDEWMRETLHSAVMTVRRERVDFSGYRAAAKRGRGPAQSGSLTTLPCGGRADANTRYPPHHIEFRRAIVVI
jgi:hypothetical protein